MWIISQNGGTLIKAETITLNGEDIIAYNSYGAKSIVGTYKNEQERIEIMLMLQYAITKKEKCFRMLQEGFYKK